MITLARQSPDELSQLCKKLLLKALTARALG